MAATTSSGRGGSGPRRVWLVAVAFGVVSSAILAVLALVATGSTSEPAGAPTPSVAPGPTDSPGSAGSAPAADPAGGDGARVVIVGDSITEWGQPTLESVLSSDWDLGIDGRAGYTVAEQLPAARSLAATEPTQVIVNLGSNDVTKRVDLSRSIEDLETMVSLFPGARCVHLVTVNEGIRLGGAPLADRSESLNRAMFRLAAEDPRVRVIDWSAVVAADTDRTDGEPLLDDTVHPTARGEQVLAELYRDALEECAAG